MYAVNEEELSSMKRICLAEEIVMSDAFVSLSLEARALYTALQYRADDDGVVNSATITARLIGVSESCIAELCENKFLIDFPKQRVCVIKHWWVHNPKRSDRYKPSKYVETMAELTLESDKIYHINTPNGNRSATKWQPNGNQMAAEVNISKCNVSKVLKTIEQKKHATSLPLVDAPVQNVKNDTNDTTANDTTKNAPQKHVSLFDEFWRAYPRKIGKQKCINYFKAHKVQKPLLDKMLKSIAEQKQSEQWQKDSGQYIPHPYTWLNQGRWDDETDIDLSNPPTAEQVAKTEQMKQEFIEARANEKISLLERRLSDAKPNSAFAYSLELQIKVAKGELTQEQADKMIADYEPLQEVEVESIPLNNIDLSALGFKKL